MASHPPWPSYMETGRWAWPRALPCTPPPTPSPAPGSDSYRPRSSTFLRSSCPVTQNVLQVGILLILDLLAEGGPSHPGEGLGLPSLLPVSSSLRKQGGPGGGLVSLLCRFSTGPVLRVNPLLWALDLTPLPLLTCLFCLLPLLGVRCRVPACRAQRQPHKCVLMAQKPSLVSGDLGTETCVCVCV